jgi:hypothetical protein
MKKVDLGKENRQKSLKLRLLFTSLGTLLPLDRCFAPDTNFS